MIFNIVQNFPIQTFNGHCYALKTGHEYITYHVPMTFAVKNVVSVLFERWRGLGALARVEAGCGKGLVGILHRRVEASFGKGLEGAGCGRGLIRIPFGRVIQRLKREGCPKGIASLKSAIKL